MGRLLFVALVIGLGLVVASGGVRLEGLEDKLGLVALLPGVYIMGLLLLRD